MPLLMLLVTSPIGTLEQTGERTSGASGRRVKGRMTGEREETGGWVLGGRRWVRSYRENGMGWQVGQCLGEGNKHLLNSGSHLPTTSFPFCVFVFKNNAKFCFFSDLIYIQVVFLLVVVCLLLLEPVILEAKRSKAKTVTIGRKLVTSAFGAYVSLL